MFLKSEHRFPSLAPALKKKPKGFFVFCQNRMMRRWEDLPDEIWESIIRHFDPHHRNFQSFSLVCKRFRSLSYRLRTALALSAHAPPSISFFLLRFPNLTRIDLVHPRPDLEILIALLSKSHLKLQSLHLSNQDRYPAAVMKELGQTMKTLKSLTCSFFGVLLEQDLVAIGDSFPNLEELDISYPQGDDRDDEYWMTRFEDGIDQMAFKLRELRAINISGNPLLSSEPLDSLFNFCPFLNQVMGRECNVVTRVSPPVWSNSWSCLSSVDISEHYVRDDNLLKICESNIKLRKLALSHCSGFSAAGIVKILRAFKYSLHHLDLEGCESLDDGFVSILCCYLCNVTFLNIGSSTKISSLSLYYVTENAPLLKELRMERTSLGKGTIPFDALRLNPSTTTLKLGWNNYLDDQLLRLILTAYPNIQCIDLNYCWMVTYDGLSQFGPFDVNQDLNHFCLHKSPLMYS